MQIFDTPLPVLVEVADFAVDEAGLRAYEASLPQHLESAHEGEARIRDVLGGLVDRQIMVMEARRLGYFEAAEVQRRLQGGAVEWLTKRLIDSVTGDSAGVNTPDEEQAYRNGWNRRVRLAHIELADEATAIEASEALAAGADFAEVARSRSRAPDAADGGDLARYFGFGDLPEALAAGVGNIEVGEVSDIIPTGRGFEIVRVLAADTVAFEEVREPLRRSLHQRAVRVARDRLLIELESRFELEYHGAVIAHVQEHVSRANANQAFSQSGQPLVARGNDLVLLQAGDGIRLLRAGALGRDAIVDSMSFVTALRTRVLADSLLVWEARRRGLDQDPAFGQFCQRRLEKLAVTHLRKKQVIERIVIIEEEVRRRYQLDMEKYTEHPTTEITEIVTDSLRSARQLLRRAEAGEGMIELSRLHGSRRTSHGHRHVSDVPATDEDGDLAAIREAIEGRDVGSLVGPLELASGGFAVVRIEGRFGARTRPLESVRPVLEYTLKREEKADEFERYIDSLRQAYGDDVVWHDESIMELAQRRQSGRKAPHH